MLPTLQLLENTDFPQIKRAQLSTLQINLGYLCNQSCVHCHVNAGPTRTELMSKAHVDLVLEVLKARQIKVLDLTGGAPEMNPYFKYLVTKARELGVHVIDRCNLTILFEAGYEDLAAFLAKHDVEVVASLPCYSADNVDKQRGKGVFDKSVAGLQALNALGYGHGQLKLSLVYNPQGPSLPPNQQQLEQQYKHELKSHFDIVFDQLYTITNMPIKRFGSMLISKGQFADYMTLLKHNYAAANLAQVMCRSLISVDWQGYLYDCDFNQQLDVPMPAANQQRLHLRDLIQQDFAGNPIYVADHCYGCTAGSGSSCGGALA
ncbi:MAG: arsenosugar biosynthesis radical SAM (seleno)protein ArsS [Moraxellaceae bacterium]|nr:arsenosugar biosynthesis radical SAM (seleno)protein ArsS [Moraxellaceae bacterium]MDZ4386444.1 arsenosugar biosynthesis radical SAM (seleno)protein ArsS [Moraxellaceae bacterium]